jgi:hypothetical protein
MKNFTMFRTVLAIAIAMLVFGFTAGATRASAQCPGCPTPGAGYWVNYNYVYPPSLVTIPIQVDFGSGYQYITSETADGHYTYKQDPAWGPAMFVTVYGVQIPIPSGGPIMIPTPYGVLRVETKCNPCLEIIVSY